MPPASGMSQANSSPPTRAIRSPARARPSRRRAASRMTASPAWWPRSSFTRLKWSRSSSTSENRRPWRAARTHLLRQPLLEGAVVGEPGQVVGRREGGQARPRLGVADRDAHQLGEAAEALGGVGHRALVRRCPQTPIGAPQAVARPHRRGDGDARRCPRSLGGSRCARRGRCGRPSAASPSPSRRSPCAKAGAAPGDRPRAHAGRRPVLLEAHQPAAGGADQAHRLLADQVEHRLGVVLLRDGGRHPAQRPLLVGEAAVLGLPAAQLQLGGVAGGDVLDHRGDHRRALRPDELHPHLDRVGRAVAAPVDRLELHPLHVAAAQRLDDRRERRRRRARAAGRAGSCRWSSSIG